MIDTKEDIQIYTKLMFKPCDIDAEVSRLTIFQKKNLASALAQKIAFEAVYKPSYRNEEIVTPENHYNSPNFLSYICCCFYPEHYQSTFNITTSFFIRKCLGTFCFWRNDFMEMTDMSDEVQREKQLHVPDLYGPLWLIVTYIIVLGLAANLNEFFSFLGDPSTYKFRTDYLSTAVGVNLLYRLAEILIYPSIVGCLDGELSNSECSHLVGYSALLYIFPTCLCSIPNKQIHMIMLALAAVLRTIFLGRNFSARIRDSKGIIYFVIAGSELLYYFIINSTFFSRVAVAFVVVTIKAKTPIVLKSVTAVGATVTPVPAITASTPTVPARIALTPPSATPTAPIVLAPAAKLTAVNPTPAANTIALVVKPAHAMLRRVFSHQ